jgi:mRNA interferase MazF
VVVVSADHLNASDIRTVSVAALTSNLRWAGIPGNVQIRKGTAGLDRDCVANLTQLLTLDKDDLDTRRGRLPLRLVREIDEGLRQVLEL